MFFEFTYTEISNNPKLIQPTQPFVACHPDMMILKPPSSLSFYSSKSLKYINYGKARYSFLLPPIPPRKSLHQAIQLILTI